MTQNSSPLPSTQDVHSIPDTVTVLHVDDDSGYGELVAVFLSREDDRFSIISETNPVNALERLQDESVAVNCIVSDYDMPQMNGIEFLKAVREEFPNIPFILHTGKGSEEIASEAISAGVTEYLQKKNGTSQYAILANRIRNSVAASYSQELATERRRQLETLIDNLPGFVYHCQNKPEWPILSIEGDVEEITGYPKWKLETNDLTFGGDIVHPDDRQEIWVRVQDALAERDSYEHTVRIVTADGTVRWVWERGQGLYSADGELEGLEGFITDVTETEAQRRELEDTKRRLDLALQEAEAGVWEWTIETDELYWSGELLQLLGISETEFEGTIDALATRLHPDDVKSVQDAIEHAIETDEPYHVEQRIKHTNGEYRWFDVRGHVVNGLNSNKMVGIGIDITDRKTHELELQRFREVTENVADPIYFIDRDGYFEMVNAAFVALAGTDREEIIGAPVSEFMPEADVERGTSLIRDLLHSNDRKWGTFEMRFQPTSGEELISETKFTVLTDNGEYIGSVGVLRDITARKEKEEFLEAFASIVSHDLRNPLTIATGRLELAAEDCSSDHLDHVETALSRMEALIEDVLTVAREGREVRTTEQVAIDELARSVWCGVETEHDELTAETGITVKANESRLTQVFENLFRNAVEHGGESVHVRVGSLGSGFYVEDDGPGIPEDAREPSREMGYATGDGAGLGLAIIDRIVDGHDWTLRIAGSDSGGARFEITGVDLVD